MNINLFVIIVLLFFISLTTTFSQTIEKKTKLAGDSILLKGHDFYNKNDIDSALIFIRKASLIYKKLELWEKYVGAMNDRFLINYYDKRFQKLEEIAFESNNTAITYLSLNNPSRIRAYSHLNSYYYALGNFKKSIEISKQALALNLNNKTSKVEIVNYYLNLGNSYKFSNDFENAFFFLQKAKKIQQDTILPLLSNISILHTLGGFFFNQNEIDSAIYYYEDVELILNSNRENKLFGNKEIENNIILADLWNLKKNSIKTTEYINKALALAPNDFLTIQLQETLGKIAISKGKFSQAIAVLLKGQSIADTSNKRNTPPLKARRLIDLAKAYFSSNDFKSTLTTYQNALKTLAPSFKKDNYSENPKIDQLLDKPDALTILEGKALVLQKLYQSTNDIKYLQATFSTYIAASKLIQNIRQGFINIESKKTLSEKSIPVYEGAIQSALNLYQQSKNIKYKTIAFELAESNKALLLLESINEQSAKGFAGIPDSLLEQEKDLKLQIAFLQKTALENKAKQTENKNIQDQIFDLQQELNQLTSNFEKNYPRYFELKYQNDPIRLETVQQSLTTNKNALLEYFVGEKLIYLFVITASDLEIVTIENPDLIAQMTNQLRTSLNTDPNSIDALIGFQSFTSTANTLYKLLLQEALKKLPPDLISLTIIPDDHLNYIPFSILLQQEADMQNPSYSLEALDYVLGKYPINYHYSATLLHKSQQREASVFENDFIGFAPSFQDSKTTANRVCTSDELYSLKCSSDEVAAISELVGGLTYINQQADKSTFEQFASSNRILHLATHACIDEQDASFNKIFFTDDFLTNYDLYNIELNAELAVLSACNTGSGELIKGEGVMSLARGFINAGCSSTLMSMWSVDDCATSDIMIDFYKNIKNGQRKDEALRASKLNYLHSAPATKMHPYYWAAFVPFGDMEAMEIGSGTNWVYYLLPIGCLFLLLLFLRRR